MSTALAEVQPTDASARETPTPSNRAKALEALKRTVGEHFPNLWTAVEVGLSCAATLFLANNSNPVAVIFMGGPSSSKTTVASMFAGHPHLTYVSDNFTPAAFVSQAANRTRAELEKIDLLPRIRDRLLVTPELAPIFRGKDDDLTQRFAILTRVLDGEGLTLDSGSQGQRGYSGDYLFAWLGCTTPIADKAWRVMSQLGSRLFFFLMHDEAEVSAEMLVAATLEESYRARLEACRRAVHALLDALIADYAPRPLKDARWNTRGVKWNAAKDPRQVSLWIAELARLVAVMRSEPAKTGSDGEGTEPARRELPWRAHAVLRNLACGHALVHGRLQLAEDDLPLVAQVAAASMPTDYSRIFRALVDSPGGELSVAEAKAALKVSHPETARKVLRRLENLSIVDYSEDEGQGRPAYARVRPEWAWCTRPELRAYLAGRTCHESGGVDDLPITSPT